MSPASFSMYNSIADNKSMMHHCRYFLWLWVLIAKTVAFSAPLVVDNNHQIGRRNVQHYQEWALAQPDVIMHPALEWRHHDNDDWSLQLQYGVPGGTVVLEIPYRLVWRADKECPPTVISESAQHILEQAFTKDDLQDHQDAFCLFCKLLEERKNASTTSCDWKPWLDALPTPNTAILQNDVLDAMPLHARTVALQLRHKIHIFQQAASAAADDSDTDETAPCDDDVVTAAALLVYSRAWKAGDNRTMEMVPIADMFNHHDNPANIVAQHDDNDRVIRFVFTSDNEDNNSNTSPPPLGLSYGSPAYIHRFMVVFGFVDVSVPRVSAHLLMEPLPGMSLDDLVFATRDGTPHEAVYHLIIYTLLKSHPTRAQEEQEAFLSAYTQEDTVVLQHYRERFRKPVHQILYNHVLPLLQELESLQEAAEACRSLAPVVARENEFLTQVYQQVLQYLTREESS